MNQIALYYPYIHVRDDTWLKYAALYWHQLGRLRPERYPTRDSIVAKTLDRELNWIKDYEPDHAAQVVQPSFLDLLDEHLGALRANYSVEGIHGWPDQGPLELTNVGQWSSANGSPEGNDELDSRLTYVHAVKVAWQLEGELVDSGLARRVAGRGGTWLGMHPALANVYMCALTREVAAYEQLHPVTDQALPHAALSDWSTERLAEVLLGDQVIKPRSAAAGDPVDAFLVAAFKTVVPKNIAVVPVDKIIEARKKFGPELNAYRAFVESLAERLTKLDVRSQSIADHIDLAVEQEVTDRIASLRGKFSSIGLESTTALMGVKSTLVLPAPITGAATWLAGAGPVAAGTAAVAAAAVATVPAAWRLKRRTAIKESPVGYLYHLGRELDPPSLVRRVRQKLRR